MKSFSKAEMFAKDEDSVLAVDANNEPIYYGG